jgi:integration host factor subunit beta
LKAVFHPKTGEAVNLPAKEAVHFKPGKEMRERVNAGHNKCRVTG